MASESQIAILLYRFPGPLVLRRSVMKWLKVLAASAGFVALGSAMIWWPENFDSKTPPVIAWVMVAFFGLGLPISIIQLLPGAADLTLDAEGFIMRNLFRRSSCRWSDVSAFATVQIGGQDSVAFNRHSAPESTAEAMSDHLVGRNSALPETYGLAAEDLTQLMALWQTRATENQ